MADANLTPSSQNMLPSMAETTQGLPPVHPSLPSHSHFHQIPLHLLNYPNNHPYDHFGYQVIHSHTQQSPASHEHTQPNPGNPDLRPTNYTPHRPMQARPEPSSYFASGDYRHMPNIHSDFQSFMSSGPGQLPDLGGPNGHPPFGWPSDPVGPSMRPLQYYHHPRMPPSYQHQPPQTPSFPQVRRPVMGPYPPASSMNTSLRGGGGNPASGHGSSTPPRRPHERQDVPPIASTPERHPDLPPRRPVSMSATSARPSEDNSISPRTSHRRSYARYIHDAPPGEMDEESSARIRRRRQRFQEGSERLFDHHPRHYRQDPNAVTAVQMQNLRDKLRHLLPPELPEDISPVCDICQKDYSTEYVDASEEKEVAIKLPCKHIFGEHCINTWFETCRTHKNKITCPMCRSVLVEPVSRDLLYGSRAFSEALSSMERIERMDRHEQRALVERTMRTYNGSDLGADF